MNTQPSTPETDAVERHEGNWDTKALRMTAHARRLEIERDELRAALSGRTVSCGQCNESATENQAMRDAIREAHNAIKASPYPDQQALAKLQPFLT